MPYLTAERSIHVHWVGSLARYDQLNTDTDTDTDTTNDTEPADGNTT